MTSERQSARLMLPVSERDHSQGPADAPITLVEYGDYECPYCGRAYPILKEMQRRMGDRLRFVFRNFPPHPGASPRPARCRGGGGGGRAGEVLGDARHALRAPARARRRSPGRVRRPRRPRHRPLGRGDGAGGAPGPGARGFHERGAQRCQRHPTFFINGLRHDDSYDLATLLAALEAAEEAARRSGLTGAPC